MRSMKQIISSLPACNSDEGTRSEYDAGCSWEFESGMNTTGLDADDLGDDLTAADYLPRGWMHLPDFPR